MGYFWDKICNFKNRAWFDFSILILSISRSERTRDYIEIRTYSYLSVPLLTVYYSLCLGVNLPTVGSFSLPARLQRAALHLYGLSHKTFRYIFANSRGEIPEKRFFGYVGNWPVIVYKLEATGSSDWVTSPEAGMETYFYSPQSQIRKFLALSAIANQYIS